MGPFSRLVVRVLVCAAFLSHCTAFALSPASSSRMSPSSSSPAVDHVRRRATRGTTTRRGFLVGAPCVGPGCDLAAANDCLRGGSEQEVLPPHFLSAESVDWVQLILDSFEKTFGEGMLQDLDRKALSAQEQAKEVAMAGVGVVSHDYLRNEEDPIYNYGNVEGLRTFGYAWEEFTALPSRKTCGQDQQAERNELLKTVREVDESSPALDVSAVRVTKTGKEIRISVAVWNVKDAGGRTVGQAARYTVL